MSSNRPSDLPFLEQDLALSPEDLQVLKAQRPTVWPNWWDQLTLLSELVPDAHEILGRRPTAQGWAPFELRAPSPTATP